MFHFKDKIQVEQQLCTLYELLIQPLERFLPAVDGTLAIVPDGALWGVPFTALYGISSGFLIERCNVLTVPSLRVFALLHLLKQIRSYFDSGHGAMVAPENTTAAAEGNLTPCNRGPQPRHVYLQYLLHPQASVLATRSNVKAALERCTCIHFEVRPIPDACCDS